MLELVIYGKNTIGFLVYLRRAAVFTSVVDEFKLDKIGFCRKDYSQNTVRNKIRLFLKNIVPDKWPLIIGGLLG